MYNETNIENVYFKTGCTTYHIIRKDDMKVTIYNSSKPISEINGADWDRSEVAKNLNNNWWTPIECHYEIY